MSLMIRDFGLFFFCGVTGFTALVLAAFSGVFLRVASNALTSSSEKTMGVIFFSSKTRFLSGTFVLRMLLGVFDESRGVSVFFAALFLVAAFFTATFFAGAFFLGDVVFFAAFLAVVFFVTTFFAGVFFATTFLLAVFFAGAFFWAMLFSSQPFWQWFSL